MDSLTFSWMDSDLGNAFFSGQDGLALTQDQLNINNAGTSSGQDYMGGGLLNWTNDDNDSNYSVGGSGMGSTSGWGGGDVPTDYADSTIAGSLLGGVQQWVASLAKMDAPAARAAIAEKAKNGTPEEKTFAGRMAEAILKGVSSDKVIAQVLQLGGGMLAGAAQGKMQEKQQKREDDIRRAEQERKDRNAYAANVPQMRWSPDNPKGKGLLGSVVG